MSPARRQAESWKLQIFRSFQSTHSPWGLKKSAVAMAPERVWDSSRVIKYPTKSHFVASSWWPQELLITRWTTIAAGQKRVVLVATSDVLKNNQWSVPPGKLSKILENHHVSWTKTHNIFMAMFNGDITWHHQRRKKVAVSLRVLHWSPPELVTCQDPNTRVAPDTSKATRMQVAAIFHRLEVKHQYHLEYPLVN